MSREHVQKPTGAARCLLRAVGTRVSAPLGEPHLGRADRAEIGGDGHSGLGEIDRGDRAGGDGVAGLQAEAALRQIVGEPDECLERVAEHGRTRALGHHLAVEAQHGLGLGQVDLAPIAHGRPEDQAAIGAVVGQDRGHAHLEPIHPARVDQLDGAVEGGHGGGDLVARIGRRARREAAREREREFGLDAELVERLGRDLGRAVEAHRREDAAGKRRGRAQELLRLGRGAADLVARDRRAPDLHERLLDRVAVGEIARPAGFWKGVEAAVVAARGEQQLDRLLDRGLAQHGCLLGRNRRQR